MARYPQFRKYPMKRMSSFVSGPSKRYRRSRYVGARRTVPFKRQSRRRRRFTRRSGYKSQKSVIVQSFCNPAELWLTNGPTNDFAGARLVPQFGSLDSGTADPQVVMDNSSGYKINKLELFPFEKMSLYAKLYKYYKVLYYSVKYSPALTEGNAFSATTGAGTYSGAITGDITYDVMRYSNFDIDYPNSLEGYRNLRNKNTSKTCSIYKPFYTKFKGSEYQSEDRTKNVPAKIVYQRGNVTPDNVIVSPSMEFIMGMEIPTFAGVFQSSIDPTAGTNFPPEGESVIIGNIIMGCTIKFYGPR